MILGHEHLQDRGALFLHKVVLQALLFKERFHLGRFHPPQNWTSKTRLQLLQNLKQEENNGGVPILQFEMMENGMKWAHVQQEQLLALGLLGIMCMYVL